MHRLRKYLIAGLLVWLPLVATGLVVNILMDILKWFMGFIPEQYQPQALAPFPIPGLDLAIIFLILIVILLLTGMIAANLFGRKLVKLWENFLGRIPLVRTVYKGFKQVTETIFSSSGKSFRKVLMIEYPRKGIWTLCFQTGNSVGEVQERTESHLRFYHPGTEKGRGRAGYECGPGPENDYFPGGYRAAMEWQAGQPDPAGGSCRRAAQAVRCPPFTDKLY
jgi:uncharacterized membrane protein